MKIEIWDLIMREFIQMLPPVIFLLVCIFLMRDDEYYFYDIKTGEKWYRDSLLSYWTKKLCKRLGATERRPSPPPGDSQGGH